MRNHRGHQVNFALFHAHFFAAVTKPDGALQHADQPVIVQHPPRHVVFVRGDVIHHYKPDVRIDFHQIERLCEYVLQHNLLFLFILLFLISHVSYTPHNYKYNPNYNTVISKSTVEFTIFSMVLPS